MRFRNLLFYLILTAPGLVSFSQSLYAESTILVIPASSDFGQVPAGDLVVSRFKLKNTGTHNVTVQWMEFSGSGLIAQVNPRINAGESVEVLVNWNTTELQGDISGLVILGLDAPDNPKLVFTLSGEVLAGSDKHE